MFRHETQGYEGIGAIIERLRQGGKWCAWSFSVTDGFPRHDLTAEETVSLMREEENVINAGDLNDVLMRKESVSFWTMDVERIIEIACEGGRR